MVQIENAIRYLWESLSNYTEKEEIPLRIYEKIEQNDYTSEEAFIDDLEEEEIAYLDTLLEKEIKYATQARDEVRAKELSIIYTLLF